MPTVSLSSSPATEERLIRVPLDELHPHPANPNLMPEERLEKLARNLEREGRYPPVYYLPRQDVRMDLLRRTGHHSHCPYKGDASYWTLRVGDREAENAVWSYADPFDQVAGIKDYLAFYQDRVDAIQVDGAAVTV